MTQNFTHRVGSQLKRAGTCLRIKLPGRSDLQLGVGEPDATLLVHTNQAARSLLSLNENAVIDAYLDGEIDVEGNFPAVLKFRDAFQTRRFIAWLWRFLVPRFQGQIKTNRVAIAKHYELPPEFYLSFLDPVWPAYSQGVYKNENETLTEAIERKFRFVAEACRITKDSEILEVGPGWGAFIKFILPSGVNMTALTNSPESRSFVENKYAAPRLTLVEQDFLSYRPDRRFDVITIMGVLEHLPQYGRVCRKLRTLLRPGGYAYLDASAATKKYAMAQFIYKHVFPYNHSFLHLESFLKAAEKEGLEVVTVNDDSLDYQRTIETWASNLQSQSSLLSDQFGLYHFRRFQLYLWGSVDSFASGNLQCHRLVLRAPG